MVGIAVEPGLGTSDVRTHWGWVLEHLERTCWSSATAIFPKLPIEDDSSSAIVVTVSVSPEATTVLAAILGSRHTNYRPEEGARPLIPTMTKILCSIRKNTKKGTIAEVEEEDCWRQRDVSNLKIIFALKIVQILRPISGAISSSPNQLFNILISYKN